MSKRAVIYTRVSTDEQGKKGFSLPSQLEACRKYANDNGLVVVTEFMDEFSGREINRPGLDEVRDLIGSCKVDALIVYSGDRLSRDLAHTIELRREREISGVELYKVLGGESDNSPHGRFTENVIGAVSQLESEMIVERSQRGKNQRAKSGHIIHQGYPSYGYDRVGKGKDAYYVINEYEADIVRKIFEMYTLGNGSQGPMSLRAITIYLNADEIRPPSKRAGSGSNWNPILIRRIVKNETYIGKFYWGKTRTVNKKRVRIPREKWILVEVPDLAFIDPAVFNEAQRRLKRNKELAKRNRKHKYLMSGFFRCGHCGSAVCGHKQPFGNGNAGFRYRCGSSWKYSKTYEKCGIYAVDTTAHKIDNPVWGWLKNLICDTNALEAGLQKMMENRANEVDPKRERLNRLHGLIQEYDGKVKHLVRETGKHTDETVLSVFRDEINEITNSRNALVSEYEILAVELEQIEITTDKREEIISFAESIRIRVENASFEEKRRLMDMLDVKDILFYDEQGKRVEVTCAIPSSNEVIKLHPS